MDQLKQKAGIIKLTKTNLIQARPSAQRAGPKPPLSFYPAVDRERQAVSHERFEACNTGETGSSPNNYLSFQNDKKETAFAQKKTNSDYQQQNIQYKLKSFMKQLQEDQNKQLKAEVASIYKTDKEREDNKPKRTSGQKPELEVDMANYRLKIEKKFLNSEINKQYRMPRISTCENDSSRFRRDSEQTYREMNVQKNGLFLLSPSTSLATARIPQTSISSQLGIIQNQRTRHVSDNIGDYSQQQGLTQKIIHPENQQQQATQRFDRSQGVRSQQSSYSNMTQFINKNADLTMVGLQNKTQKVANIKFNRSHTELQQQIQTNQPINLQQQKNMFLPHDSQRSQKVQEIRLNSQVSKRNQEGILVPASIQRKHIVLPVLTGDNIQLKNPVQIEMQQIRISKPNLEVKKMLSLSRAAITTVRPLPQKLLKANDRSSSSIKSNQQVDHLKKQSQLQFVLSELSSNPELVAQFMNT